MQVDSAVALALDGLTALHEVCGRRVLQVDLVSPLLQGLSQVPHVDRVPTEMVGGIECRDHEETQGLHPSPSVGVTHPAYEVVVQDAEHVPKG